MCWRRPRTIHPAVPELREQLRTGAIDRREFLRTVTLLGVTASAAYAMVGRLTGQPLVPRVQAAGKMGGNLRCSMRVQPKVPSSTKRGDSVHVWPRVAICVRVCPLPGAPQLPELLMIEPLPGPGGALAAISKR